MYDVEIPPKFDPNIYSTVNIRKCGTYRILEVFDISNMHFIMFIMVQKLCAKKSLKQKYHLFMSRTTTPVFLKREPISLERVSLKESLVGWFKVSKKKRALSIIRACPVGLPKFSPRFYMQLTSPRKPYVGWLAIFQGS